MTVVRTSYSNGGPGGGALRAGWWVFRGFRLLPLSLQNLPLEFRSVLLVLSLCPRGVIPDAAHPLNPLLVSSHESF
jgi:hypothetical protein